MDRLTTPDVEGCFPDTVVQGCFPGRDAIGAAAVVHVPQGLEAKGSISRILLLSKLISEHIKLFSALWLFTFAVKTSNLADMAFRRRTKSAAAVGVDLEAAFSADVRNRDASPASWLSLSSRPSDEDFRCLEHSEH